MLSCALSTLISVALCLDGLEGVFYLVARSRNQRERDLESSLAQQCFATPQGPVSGSQMRVVKRSCQLSGAGNTPVELFWYCVGPGPCYFLAMARVKKTGWRGTEVAWTLYPLGVQRMRGALAGDRKATALAFD